MKKCVTVTHFTMKIIYTYLHTTFNTKILFGKNILAYCGYSPTSPFFLLVSEHKHCNNAATNSNTENARSRMVASLQGNMGMGTKEDESSTGCVWTVGFHHVKPILAWQVFWNLWTIISLIFQISFGPQYTADMGVRLYFLRGKGGQCIELRPLPPSCTDCLEIWEPNLLEPSGPVQDCTGAVILTFWSSYAAAF